MKTKCIFITLCAIALNLLVSSCKKDEKADDPNITHVVINKTITPTIGLSLNDSLDLNGDNINDFNLLSYQNVAGDTVITHISTSNSLLYIDSTKVMSISAEIKPLNENETPSLVDGSYKWYYITYCGIKFGSASPLGIAGQGDKFIPVAIRVSLNTFKYGWLRINVSADCKSFKVIDGAYSTLDNTPIKMGAE